MASASANQIAVISLCFLGAGLSAAGWIAARNHAVATQGYDPTGTDFMAFYSGARLAGSTQMYNPEAIWKVQLDATGRYGKNLLFIRLPCFALLLWPLAQLPYAAAKYIWILLQLTAVIAAVFLWPGSRKLAAIVACWSFPVVMCLADGADTALLFLWLVLWRRLELKNRPVWAGIALALCIAKFHLFLFLPLLLLRNRRRLVVKGVAIGATMLVSLSYLAAGWSWPAEYLRVLTTSGISPSRTLMPNIHGLMPPEWELPALVITIVVTCLAIFCLDYIDATVVTLAGSLLCSYHAYVMDGVILLPAIMLVMEKYFRPGKSSVGGRVAVYIAGILATPLPWIAVLMRGG